MGSIADDQLRILNSQLEFCMPVLPSVTKDSTKVSQVNIQKLDNDKNSSNNEVDIDEEKFANHITYLKNLIEEVSSKPNTRQVSLDSIVKALEKYLVISRFRPNAEHRPSSPERSKKELALAEKELEWVLIAATTISLYGYSVRQFLSRALPVSQDIYYWDSVLDSSSGLLIYSLQTSPARAFNLLKDVYYDSKQQLQEINLKSFTTSPFGFFKNWITAIINSFNNRRLRLNSYMLHPTSFLNLFVSPISFVKKEVYIKRQRLRKLQDLQASSLGVLIAKGLSMTVDQDWHDSIETSIDFIHRIIESSTDIYIDQTAEEKVVSLLPKVQENDSDDNGNNDSNNKNRRIKTSSNKRRSNPYFLAKKLIKLIKGPIPFAIENESRISKENGKPPFLTRYWPIITSGLVFGSTGLQMITNRKAEISQWISDSLVTCYDFWMNWVISPVKRIISTIRHDDKNQVAIVSSKSLSTDMESLERMVVNFVMDTENDTISPSAIKSIKEGVRKGDLTVVLKVYEDELRSPIYNAIRGELIRTMLIQLQKTKVDVEIAISGIDNLLKSQELLFGVLAITPSGIITYLMGRSIYRLLTGRGIQTRSQEREHAVFTLRKIERILNSSSSNEKLSYGELGMILCQTQVLRSFGVYLPRIKQRDWIEDLQDLENINLGRFRQLETIQRIWRIYGEYFKS